MAGVDQFTQGMTIGRQLAEATAERVDKQDHQRPPEPVVDGTGNAVGVAGCGRGVKGRGPDPGSGHARRAHAITNVVPRHHEAGSVLFVLADQQGQQVGATVEGSKQ